MTTTPTITVPARTMRMLRRLFDEHGWDFTIYEHYSGRGMFGRYARFALTTSTRPESPLGRALKSRGFAVDSLGMDFIYYRGSVGREII